MKGTTDIRNGQGDGMDKGGWIKFVLIAMLALLSGCAAQQMQPFLDNLHHDCVRHYTGSVGGTLGALTVAFDIQCNPGGTVTTTTVTTPVVQPPSGQ